MTFFFVNDLVPAGRGTFMKKDEVRRHLRFLKENRYITIEKSSTISGRKDVTIMNKGDFKSLVLEDQEVVYEEDIDHANEDTEV